MADFSRIGIGAEAYDRVNPKPAAAEGPTGLSALYQTMPHVAIWDSERKASQFFRDKDGRWSYRILATGVTAKNQGLDFAATMGLPVLLVDDGGQLINPGPTTLSVNIGGELTKLPPQSTAPVLPPMTTTEVPGDAPPVEEGDIEIVDTSDEYWMTPWGLPMHKETAKKRALYVAGAVGVVAAVRALKRR